MKDFKGFTKSSLNLERNIQYKERKYASEDFPSIEYLIERSRWGNNNGVVSLVSFYIKFWSESMNYQIHN